jgi:hypothetical protein
MRALRRAGQGAGAGQEAGRALRRLNTLERGLLEAGREAAGLERKGALARVQGLRRLCRGAASRAGREEGAGCEAAEYEQGRAYIDSIDSVLRTVKAAMGDVQEVRRLASLGLLGIQELLERRVAGLFSASLCCPEEAEWSKGPAMARVASCQARAGGSRAELLRCLLRLRAAVAGRRAEVLSRQLHGWGGAG